MKTQPISLVIPITWLSGTTHGWGCGYVAVPPTHPLHGKDFMGWDDEDIPSFDVHGGITYSDTLNEYTMKDLDIPSDWWIVGFDTAHMGDDLESCSEEYVRAETERLLAQINEKYPQ